MTAPVLNPKRPSVYSMQAEREARIQRLINLKRYNSGEWFSIKDACHWFHDGTSYSLMAPTLTYMFDCGMVDMKLLWRGTSKFNMYRKRQNREIMRDTSIFRPLTDQKCLEIGIEPRRLGAPL